MKYYIKLFLQRCIALAVLPLRLFPVRKNRILFLSLEGGSVEEYSCNPRYLCEYILAKDPDSYELVWLFRRPELHRDLISRGIRIGKHFTLRGFYYCLTSRVIVTNGGYLTWFPFRRGQIRINTWHGGGAYKRLENDRTGANRATAKRMEYCNRNTTAFVSSSELFTKYAIRGAFRFTGEVLSCGMPRNDIFFSPQSPRWYEEIRRKYSISQEGRILLYAPTFREDNGSFDPIPAEEVLRRLKKSTGEDWYLLYRAHTKTTDRQMLTGLNDHCIDVHTYPDTQQLLCAADLLLTDYSSIVWDFCLTGRPVVLYTPDLPNYQSVQGFYLDITEWGFPMCYNTEELARTMDQIMVSPQMNGSDAHQELLGSLESGEACSRILSYIREHI